MILNPSAVLNELVKYERIVNFSRMAIDRLAKGQPVDDIRDILKIRLDECAFTQVTGLGTATTPLHSVTEYIDKADVLKKQIGEAEAFSAMIVEKIQSEVGPFYTKNDVTNFKEAGDITLGDQVWGPTMEAIKVKKYIDPKSGVVSQVDWTHGQYRTAKDDQSAFGQWKFFVK